MTMINLLFGLELMLLSYGVYYAEAANPVFVTPPAGGGTRDIAEDAVVGSSILALDASDADGQTLNYLIVSQDPATPVFMIDASDELIVPSGLDHETTTSFSFTFSVSDGTNTATTTYTLTITDVDDTAPVFNPSTYAETITVSTPTGTSVVTVTATDVDSGSSFSYGIQGAQTTFGIDSTGLITVIDQSGLAALLGSPINLIVEASDNTNTGTATFTVTVVASPCNSSPCQNSGTCTNTGTSMYSCTCLTGYIGTNCQSVNYCLTNYCQHGGTCTSEATSYTCECSKDGCYKNTGQNCTGPTDDICKFCEKPDTIPICVVCGIVIGIMFIHLLIGLIIFCCCRKNADVGSIGGSGDFGVYLKFIMLWSCVIISVSHEDGCNKVTDDCPTNVKPGKSCKNDDGWWTKLKNWYRLNFKHQNSDQEANIDTYDGKKTKRNTVDKEPIKRNRTGEVEMTTSYEETGNDINKSDKTKKKKKKKRRKESSDKEELQGERQVTSAGRIELEPIESSQPPTHHIAPRKLPSIPR